MKKMLLFLLTMFIFHAADAQKFYWNNNKVIAHRGAWKKKNFPGNSIASLKEAIRLGCYGSEFDVQMTMDNVLLVNHDDSYMGVVIEKSSYEKLKPLRLSNGEKIPTLEEYIKEGKKQYATKLILEIKPSIISKERGIKIADETLKLVKKLNAMAWIDFISFDYDICKRIVESYPDAKVYYLNGDKNPQELKADKMTGADYNLEVYQQNDWIDDMKKMGLLVNVWTVNALPDMQWFISKQVDFITTDEPELLFEELGKTNRSSSSDKP